jgi:serine/threonine protein kinase
VLERGTTLGRYRVLEKLAARGMGVVYAAYDPELDRRVALKLLRAMALGLDAEEGRQHRLREAQAMARVSHLNVVPVYDVGTCGQQVFLAMELVRAQTLRQWMKEAPRT